MLTLTRMLMLRVGCPRARTVRRAGCSVKLLTHTHSPPQAQVQVLERQLHEATREREGLEVRLLGS